MTEEGENRQGNGNFRSQKHSDNDIDEFLEELEDDQWAYVRNVGRQHKVDNKELKFVRKFCRQQEDWFFLGMAIQHPTLAMQHPNLTYT